MSNLTHNSIMSKGIDLLRRLAEENLRIFTIEQARKFAPEYGISENYLVSSLYRLQRNDWIIPLRRGLYALSPPLIGGTPLHEYEIAIALVTPAAISHWSALHYHHLTDQIPNTVYILTKFGSSIPKSNRGTSTYEIAGILYQFIQIKPDRFFGIENAWIGDAQIQITDPERTLIDAISIPKYCGNFSEVLHAFSIRKKELNLEKIISYALKFDVVVAKRLGWILELNGIPRKKLEPLIRLKSKGYGKLDPTKARKGKYNTSWMIIENHA